MMITMPLMFGYLAMQMPAGLSIYFIVSNLVGMGIQWATNRWLSNGEEETLPAKRPAAAVKKEDEPESSSKKRTYKKRGYRRKD
jgi:membrane protein insertase Oxa1/YidC/SpoIIIJ